MTQTTVETAAARQRAREKAQANAAAQAAGPAQPLMAIQMPVGNGDKANGIVTAEMVTLLQPAISPAGISVSPHTDDVDRVCLNGSEFV